MPMASDPVSDRRSCCRVPVLPILIFSVFLSDVKYSYVCILAGGRFCADCQLPPWVTLELLL